MPFETPNTGPVQPPSVNPSGLEPLRIRLFRDRWIASAVSSVGTWMQDTAGTWFMTALTPSPLLIALMQTAASLPVLLLGLLAGASADIFDRRKLLIFWQSWMLASVGLLAILTFFGWVSPWVLLGLTFLLNAGTAMNNPAWQAIVPELVPRDIVPDAVAINAASNNLARALGPALGGLLVAAFQRVTEGAGTVFVLNAASYAAVIWVLVNWKRQALFRSALPSERIAASIRFGLRYIRYAPDIQAPLVRAFCFTFSVSAIWSLLAVVALRVLHQGALGYGILNGSLGLGALIAATTLPYLRRHVAPDQLIAYTTAWILVGLLILAYVPLAPIVILALIASGYAWTSTMSTLNAAIQMASPPWVQARAMGSYLMSFQGGLALGSVLWGVLATHYSTHTALAASAALMAASYPWLRRFHIPQGPFPNTSAYHWPYPPPRPIAAPASDRVNLDPHSWAETGPVRISIEYSIAPEDYAAFTHAIHALGGVRMRDGAIRWGIYRDALHPERMNETFLMESWLDFLRARERMTAEDERVRQRARAFHQEAAGPPKVSYQIYAEEIASGPAKPASGDGQIPQSKDDEKELNREK